VHPDSAKPLAQTIRQKLPEATRAAVNELVRIGEQPAIVNLQMGALRKGLRVHVVSDSNLREALAIEQGEGDDWQRFRAVYGGATSVVSFSRVGSDPSSGQALVVSSINCGTLCGAGNLVLLQRRYGVWSVMKVGNLWVS